MQKKEIYDNIFLYEDFLDEFELNFLLKIAKDTKEDDWQEVYIKQGEELDKNSENYQKYLKFKNTWTKTTYVPNDLSIFESIKNKVLKVIEPNLTITEELYRIKRLTEGRAIDVHYDNVMDFSLKSGVVLYLNDNFNGGEIFYPEFDFQYKPKANTLIIHPASEQYRHGVKEVIGDTRYSLAFFLSTLTYNQRKIFKNYN